MTLGLSSSRSAPPSARHAGQRGFTLIEVIVATLTLSLSGLGIASAFLQSRRIAESNIFETTALTVAQGYLEQIKAMDYSVLEDAAANPSTDLLPTLGVTHDGAGNTSIVTQPLQVLLRNPVGVFDGGTHMGILIDMQRDSAGNQTVPRYMRMWVTPTLSNILATENRRCMEIILFFEWEARDLAGNNIPRSRYIRLVSSHVPSF